MIERGEPDPNNDQRWCGVHNMHAADCFEIHYPNAHDAEALRAAVDARHALPPEAAAGPQSRMVSVAQHPGTGLWQIVCPYGCNGGGNYASREFALVMAEGHAQQPHPRR